MAGYSIVWWHLKLPSIFNGVVSSNALRVRIGKLFDLNSFLCESLEETNGAKA
jgi:hypothetical protein